MSASTSTGMLTVGEVAARFGVYAWQVRRVFEQGLMPPAKRVGAYRVVEEEDLRTIKAALERLGYLRPPAA
jgi:DNA-binding transcriptional MerR regulator